MSKVKFITLEKLLEMKANEEEFTLVDALPKEAYEKGHLPGAVNIPSDDVADAASEKLEKNATIVTYCANYGCEASTIAARKLLDLDYANVVDFKGGKKVWQEAGFELES